MGLESESFLVLYELGDLGRMRHFCVGDNCCPDVSERPLDNYNPVNRTSGGDQLYFNGLEGILVQFV